MFYTILVFWICFSCDYYFSWRNLVRFKEIEETFLSFFLFLEFIKCSTRYWYMCDYYFCWWNLIRFKGMEETFRRLIDHETLCV